MRVAADISGSSCAQWKEMGGSFPLQTGTGCGEWGGVGMDLNQSSGPCSTCCSSTDWWCSHCHTRLCCKGLWAEPSPASRMALGEGERADGKREETSDWEQWYISRQRGLTGHT